MVLTVSWTWTETLWVIWPLLASALTQGLGRGIVAFGISWSLSAQSLCLVVPERTGYVLSQCGYYIHAFVEVMDKGFCGHPIFFTPKITMNWSTPQVMRVSCFCGHVASAVPWGRSFHLAFYDWMLPAGLLLQDPIILISTVLVSFLSLW